MDNLRAESRRLLRTMPPISDSNNDDWSVNDLLASVHKPLQILVLVYEIWQSYNFNQI